jgi:hypothetical protein
MSAEPVDAGLLDTVDAVIVCLAIQAMDLKSVCRVGR